MDKLISSEKLIHDLSGIRDTLPDIFLKHVMSTAISCVEKQPQALCDYDLENVKPGQRIDAHEKYPQFRMRSMYICPRCYTMIPIKPELPIMSLCPNCGKRMYRRDCDVESKNVWHSQEGDSK